MPDQGKAGSFCFYSKECQDYRSVKVGGPWEGEVAPSMEILLLYDPLKAISSGRWGKHLVELLASLRSISIRVVNSDLGCSDWFYY